MVGQSLEKILQHAERDEGTTTFLRERGLLNVRHLAEKGQQFLLRPTRPAVLEMDSPVQEEIQDGKMTQDVRENQHDIPLIWPREFDGDTNPGELMRAFDNF
eukprot:8984450-Karenia_brevis.AAC.1